MLLDICQKKQKKSVEDSEPIEDSIIIIFFPIEKTQDNTSPKNLCFDGRLMAMLARSLEEKYEVVEETKGEENGSD